MSQISRWIRRAGAPVLGAMAVMLPAASWALVTAGPCGGDDHVRCAVYDANEVYRIPFRAGNAALVQLEEGEVIDGPASGLGVGDAKAWTVGAKSNWIMFKPHATNAQTNLVIVTDRRRYVFDLVNAGRNDTPVWSMSFDYPDTRARLAAEAAKKSARAAAVAKSSASESLHRNADYDMHGDTVLAPTAMWDDGRFTYFQYATSRDLPVIFRVLPDGAEALVNSHMEGDTVVVHDTSASFVLRLGQSVLGIRNNAYSPDGEFNHTGTTVPGTVRLSKEKNGE
ncbi:Type IV secretion system protein virB9 [Paraburkholderia nemoris]|uniref:TrbG/VirB9 family P-type conjugative transfer protein n=1 Tax=Paraburkholderia nemoris TaxID=2793076 RepID=UPI00190DA791|nr:MULTISPECIES: TrbG/VirB9 family P-type conjugative transfer protein [Paraburkholderia]MBK3786054.1 TrbG/VirB9 family P-type conjugative transfer protein [Paraburkholderia aspalathi]CAE6847046.1 Type IV secretion system protein virB9 [Paraburkholderia nemoris]